MIGLGAFKSARLVGAALPAEAVTRAAEGAMPGQKPGDYLLPSGLTVSAAAARAWEVLLPAHQAWKAGLARLPVGEADTKFTREKWLLPLLYELGYGRPASLQSGVDLPPGLGETKPSHFTLSHQLAWPGGGTEPTAALAVHLLGPSVDLEHRTAGVTARAPHAMIQEFVNRSPAHLWAILSNGATFRVLRDASSLARQSFLEFDLDLIFENQFYADFRLLFTVLHATRLIPRVTETTEGRDPRPEDCWLEEWRTTAINDGARALDALRDGVATAITALGTGFLAHPANAELVDALSAKPGAKDDLHRWVLRIAYRLIVLFVAEDRDLLHPEHCDIEARALYEQHFGSARLRRLAATRSGSSHSDLWEAHRLVTDALGGDGNPALALPGLAASLYEPDATGLLCTAQLSNRHLLAAVRALSQVADKQTGSLRPVDYRNLDSEELGSVYEGLLAYIPQYDPAARTFTLAAAPGSERKTSGSYYTGGVLIGLILDETLDPLIDEALRASDPEKALLTLTVCDPACGSGHFLVAAARRIAKALAGFRTHDPEPAPEHVRAALRQVVARCIYGVDRNDLAIEIAKIALWLETLERGKPFAFLDAHLKVGDALLGTTPALLRSNIPDAAFSALLGDDKTWTSTLRKHNKEQRNTGQLDLFSTGTLSVATPGVSSQTLILEATSNDTLADVRARADAWRRLEEGEELVNAKRLADAWCAAFVQPKWKGPGTAHGPDITHGTLVKLEADPLDFDPHTSALIDEIAREYRFFHWHLEFPGVFQVSDDEAPKNPLGWNGGFSCIIGNPPWDTLSPDTREFFGGLVPDIRRLSKAEKGIQIEILLQDEHYQAEWDRHQRRLFATAHFLKTSGRYTLYAKGNLGKGDFNIYRSFAELALTFTQTGGYAGQILQSGIYAGANASAIRKHLLDECTWTAVYGFNNKGETWFPVTLENFGAYAARVGAVAPSGHEIRAAFGMHRPETLPADLAAKSLTFDAEDIRDQNPETYAIPDIRDPRAARLTKRLYKTFPAFGRSLPGLPLRDYQAEIHMSDRHGVFQSDLPGRPIYEGRMIDFFDHRAKRYVSGHGNSSLWEETPFGSARKCILPQWYVNPQKLNAATRARIGLFRVGFMDVADPGRQRSFCSAVVPPQTVCGDKVPTIIFPEADWYLPVYLAVADTLVVDFLARQRVLSKAMKFNILDSMPIARLEQSDTRSKWLAERALRLTCTSVEMTPLWNDMARYGWVEPCMAGEAPGETDPVRRRLLRAEIDAFVAREVYGLSKSDLELIFDSFTQLQGIEIKAYEEFLTRRLVLEAFNSLAAQRDRVPAPSIS